MKNELKLLTEEVEKKVGKKIHVESLNKVWGYMSGKEKPTKETQDKLALFVGYQSWDDFREALHGEDDGELSYGISDEQQYKGNPSK